MAKLSRYSFPKAHLRHGRPRRLVSTLVFASLVVCCLSGFALARGMQRDREAAERTVSRADEVHELRNLLKELNEQLRTLLAVEPTFASQGAALSSALQAVATTRTVWASVRTAPGLGTAQRDAVDAWYARDLGSELPVDTTDLGPLVESVAVAFNDVRVDVLDLSDQANAEVARGIGELSERSETEVIRVSAVVAVLGGLLLVTAVIARRDERRRARFADRNQSRVHLETKVKRALGMVDSEDDAVAVLLRATSERAGGTVSAMMADSSRAHFQRWGGGAATCSADSPAGCPAARGGQTLVFESSDDIDGCRHLTADAGSPCGAVCVPMSVDGATIGVLHHTRAAGEPPKELVADIELVAGGAAQRIGMLRALHTSQMQAATDPLTGLPNRRHLEERLRSLRLTATPYSVAYLDLDHFKQLNDRHGHETGDRALSLFARVCLETLRSEDMVARFGGEEFVLVLPRANVVTAREILERLRANLLSACGVSAFPSFTASAGLAVAELNEPIDQLLARADAALLTAKRTGRDRVVVAGDDHDEELARDLAALPSSNGPDAAQPGPVHSARDDELLVSLPGTGR